MWTHLLLTVVLAQTAEGATTALGASASSPASDSVLILPVRTQGDVKPHLAELAAEIIAATLRKASSITVTTFAEVEDLLTQEQRKMLAGCNSDSCATEIAGSLNAVEVIRTTLGRLGESYVITLTRIRAREARAVDSAARQFASVDEEAVSSLIPNALCELFPNAKELRNFRINTASSSPVPVAPVEKGNPITRTLSTTLRLAGSFAVFSSVLGTLIAGAALLVSASVVGTYLYSFWIPTFLDPASAQRHSAEDIERFRYMGGGGSVGMLVSVVAGIMALTVGAVGVAMVASTFIFQVATE